MVLVGGADDITKWGYYRLARVARTLPQIFRGRAIVRRAIITVMALNKETDVHQATEVKRHLSKLALLEFYEQLYPVQA